MPHVLNDPALTTGDPEDEIPDTKVVRLMPRRSPATERVPEPPRQDDDENDDPGPSAA